MAKSLMVSRLADEPDMAISRLSFLCASRSLQRQVVGRVEVVHELGVWQFQLDDAFGELGHKSVESQMPGQG